MRAFSMLAWSLDQSRAEFAFQRCKPFSAGRTKIPCPSFTGHSVASVQQSTSLVTKVFSATAVKQNELSFAHSAHAERTPCLVLFSACLSCLWALIFDAGSYTGCAVWFTLIVLSCLVFFT